jgi:hypothetical protein
VAIGGIRPSHMLDFSTTWNHEDIRRGDESRDQILTFMAMPQIRRKSVTGGIALDSRAEKISDVGSPSWVPEVKAPSLRVVEVAGMPY